MTLGEVMSSFIDNLEPGSFVCSFIWWKIIKLFLYQRTARSEDPSEESQTT